jgi:hypothetical protein
MRFKQLTVLIDRNQTSQILKANVINYSAEGMIKGKSLLTRNYKNTAEAMIAIRNLLASKTDSVIFEFTETNLGKKKATTEMSTWTNSYKKSS